MVAWFLRVHGKVVFNGGGVVFNEGDRVVFVMCPLYAIGIKACVLYAICITARLCNNTRNIFEKKMSATTGESELSSNY